MYGGDEFDDDGHNTNTCTRWFYDIITLPRELVELEGKFVGFRLRYFVSVVPLVNWIYDLFFTSKVPGYGAIKELLNVAALVNALLLGAILALASSVNREELLHADNVWFNNTTSPASKWYRGSDISASSSTIPPSASLHENASVSLSLFFVGLIGVVWVYTDLLAKTGKTKNSAYWSKFFEMRDGYEGKFKVHSGLFDRCLRTDPLILLESRFDELGDVMWDTPDRRAAVAPLFDEQRDERWKRKMAIEHCLYRAPNGFTPRPEIEVEVKVYSQMSIDTLGKMLVNLQNEEARVYEREVLLNERRREMEGNMRGHAFFIWWGFAKYSVLLVIVTTAFGCIFCVLSMRDLFIIKYPDAFVEKYGYSDVAHGLSNWSSPTSFGNAWFQLVFAGCAAFIVCCTGLGTAQKYRRENKYRTNAAADRHASIPLGDYQRTAGTRVEDFIPPRDGAYFDSPVSTPTSPLQIPPSQLPPPSPAPARTNP